MEKEQNPKVDFAIVVIAVILLGITGFAIGFIATRATAKKILGAGAGNGMDAPPSQPIINATVTPNYGGGSTVEKSYTSPPENLNTETIPPMIYEPPGFPLVKLSGAALHTANPYVKDVQQYCNKKGGLKIDIDGAFGRETESAVMRVLGTKTVTWNQYKTIIAPYLGK